MADEPKRCMRAEREQLLKAAGLPPGEIEPGIILVYICGRNGFQQKGSDA